MDNLIYIDIPLMINICRSSKPKAVSAYKVNWYCFLALYDNIYYLDDYLQVAYYCCWSESSQTCLMLDGRRRWLQCFVFAGYNWNPLHNIIVSRCIVRL